MSLCSCFMLPTIWRTCWGRQIQEGSPSFVTCDLDCYGTKFQCDVGIICLLPFISINLHPVSLQYGVFNHKVFNGEEYFILLHCQNILNIIIFWISEYPLKNILLKVHWVRRLRLSFPFSCESTISEGVIIQKKFIFPTKRSKQAFSQDIWWNTILIET